MDQNPSYSNSNHIDSTSLQPSDPAKSANAAIGDVAQNAKQIADELAARARKVAERQFADAKRAAADRIGGVADALRSTGDQLRSQASGTSGGQGVSEYVEQAVDRLDAASGYLQNSSFSAILSDVEGFARREPAIFLGGVFILGLLGGRFLKSSGAPRSTADRQGRIDADAAGETADEMSSHGDRTFVPGVV